MRAVLPHAVPGRTVRAGTLGLAVLCCCEVALCCGEAGVRCGEVALCCGEAGCADRKAGRPRVGWTVFARPVTRGYSPG
ncbi:hypothetical protein Sgleb_51890 [Streptomyces glebosus]|uniref:Uncharacterized protein n=1 Tax=Streptomyces glebosus TaxID=249580 RepID=A0A640T276_9ACTN|nr:hypothetical protein Sgleb_51890 [Streptomyces glebosus]